MDATKTTKRKRKPVAPRCRINGRDTAGQTPMLSIRVPPDQVARWKRAADRRGQSLSEFVREAADANTK